ncbi:MAG: prenyltransferase/squalene oxidase repeat-containing protein [Promethearchaeota archaeon]
MLSKRSRIISATLIIMAFLIIIPYFGLAATRKEKISDFIKSTQDEGSGGFYEYPVEDTYHIKESIIATRSAVVVMSDLNMLDQINKDKAKYWMLDKINEVLDAQDLNDLSYLLSALNSTESIDEIDSKVHDDILAYLSSLKIEDGSKVGYAFNPNASASVMGTYYVLESYYYLGLIELVPTENVTQFILSCFNSSIGGFILSPTSNSPSLTYTFYALESLYLINKIGEIQNKSIIMDYIQSFYVDNTALTEHYGGYSFYPQDELPYTSFVATYYAIMSLKDLYAGYKITQPTLDWILKHQNPDDGGFVENPIVGQEMHSSTITTYYAVKLLEINYPDLSILDEDAWSLTINWWAVGGVSALIVVIIMAIIIVYKRKTAI